MQSPIGWNYFSIYCLYNMILHLFLCYWKSIPDDTIAGYLEVDRDDQLWKYDAATKQITNLKQMALGQEDFFGRYKWDVTDTETIRANFDGEF